jgi:hypothetical protein
MSKVDSGGGEKDAEGQKTRHLNGVVIPLAHTPAPFGHTPNCTTGNQFRSISPEYGGLRWFRCRPLGWRRMA